jgi:hypothetical protein
VKTMTEFMDEIRSAPEPVGFGLIGTDYERTDNSIVEVKNPRFITPFPNPEMQGALKMLMVPAHIITEVVASLNAQPIERVPGWWRFGIWEQPA